MRIDDANRDAVFQEEAMPHVDALYGAAMRYTRSRRDAEDLVQDTLMKAYSNFDKYTPGTNCKAWMFRILTNTFINRYRKKQRERNYLSEDVDGRSLDERAEAREENEFELRGETELESAARLFGDEINQALSALSFDFRAVVMLVDVYDFSYKESAEILDCPPGTVMSRLYRGRRMLRSRLAEYAVEGGYIRGLSDEHQDQISADRGETLELRGAGGK